MLDAAFGWIGDLAKWAAQFVPHWKLVRATEGAIKFKPGGRTEAIGPGLHGWWPLTTEIEVVPVVRQVLRCKPQTLMTKDGVSVYVSGLAIYKIVDLTKYAVENFDAMDNIDDVVQTAIRKTVVNRLFSILQLGRVKVDNALTNEAQKALASFGIEVEEAKLTDFARAEVINLVGPGILNQTTSHVDSKDAAY